MKAAATSRKRRIPSTVIAVLIALAAAAWVGSGYLEGMWNLSGSPENLDAVSVRAAPRQADPIRVRVATLDASAYIEEVQASGETQAIRTVEIRAETDGRIVDLPVAEGREVKQGALLVKLDRAERDAQLAQAKARVMQREIEHKAARELASSGYQTQTRRAEAHADLEAARADLEVLEVDLARTEIVAPFDGILDQRPAEFGSFVQRGDHVATLVDIDPALVIAQVPEQDIAKLEVGMPAHTRLSTGLERMGVVRYVAAVADTETRTFRVEVEVENPDRRIRDGMTSEIKVELPPVAAHVVPPSIFRLDDNGRIGVMLVQDDNTVKFVRISIINSAESGVYVTGLPAQARIVMVGQELVQDGEKVIPVSITPKPATPSAAANEAGAKS